jgi:glycosyltransferase involved in cell wall biosynthesis
MNLASVVVPVFDANAEPLRRCLAALSRQSYSKRSMEIIVVDNGSSFDVREVCDEFENVRCVHEPIPGSYAARNCGVRQAKGSIIAFTDSDCTPTETWLESVVNKTKNPGSSIVGGKIQFINPVDRPLNNHELMEQRLFGMGNHRRLIEQRGFAVTANMAALRSVFDRVGLFDQDLKSSGDREWSQRAVKMGYALQYVDDAVVFHPRRMTLNAICIKQRRIVDGRMKLLMKKGASARETLSLLFTHSILDPSLYIYATTSEDIPTIRRRLTFMAAAAVITSLTTFERIRIFFGGTAARR